MQRLTSDWNAFPHRLDKKGDDFPCARFVRALNGYSQEYSTYIGRPENCYMWWARKHMINIAEGEAAAMPLAHFYALSLLV